MLKVADTFLYVGINHGCSICNFARKKLIIEGCARGQTTEKAASDFHSWLAVVIALFKKLCAILQF